MNESRVVLLFLVGLSAFAIASSLAPLAAYTLALGAFGLPHVFSELRYVDQRFGRGLTGRLFLGAGLPLLAIVATRAAVVAHFLAPETGALLELSCAILPALACANGTLLRRTVALFFGGGVAAASWAAPFSTLVVFSVLHNFTPLGFLWQISSGRERRRLAAFASFVFFALPFAVAMGLPRMVFGDALTDVDPLNAGPLSSHFGVYVPHEMLNSAQARDLFAASVTAQGAHYFCVLVLLPALLRRLDPGAGGLFVWPKGRVFIWLCVGAGAAALLGFVRDFVEARAIYGIIASFHAWIEIPILITALTVHAPASSASPRNSELAFAASETSIARSMRSNAIQEMSAPSARTTTASRASSDGQTP